MDASGAYLDYNATAPLRPAARAAALRAMDACGNPSSVHQRGRAAKACVESARREVAELVGSPLEGVVFASGASEAAALVLTPDWSNDDGDVRFSRLYVLASEHPCILAGGRFAADEVISIPVNADGVIDMDTLERLLATHDASVGRPMVAIQAANSETGVLQPVARCAEIIRRHDGFLVCDAVQAAGRVPISIAGTGADAMIVSSHKIGGPMGAGALALSDPSMKPSVLIGGGGQELSRRGGTENVSAIAGFGAAAAQANLEVDSQSQIIALRDSIEQGLIPICGSYGELVVFGRDAQRLPNTLAFALAGLEANTALIGLDLAGIAVSSGSACSSGKVGKSHVLAAMGVDETLARCALRLSLGWNSSQQDADAFLSAFAALLARRAGNTNSSLSGAA